MGHLLVFFLVMSIYLVWVVLEDKKEKKDSHFFPVEKIMDVLFFCYLLTSFVKRGKKCMC